MFRLKSLRLFGCVALLALAGCAGQQQYATVEQICIAGASRQKLMQTAEDVLAKMHFTIAKSDPVQGIIRTRPLRAAQVFEFWRSDNIGSFNTAYANLHNIRRTVQLNINQQDRQLCIDCDVKVQRLSRSEPRGTDRPPDHDRFSESPLRHNLKLKGLDPALNAWVNLNPDEMLATHILKQIEKKLKVETKE